MQATPCDRRQDVRFELRALGPGSTGARSIGNPQLAAAAAALQVTIAWGSRPLHRREPSIP
nr:hypothetical protein [Nitrosomonas nitrosa]